MPDRRQLPLRVGGVALLDSPITCARKRGRLTLDAAAECLDMTVLGLLRVEAATRRLPLEAQAAMVNRLADRARSYQQLSLFDGAAQ